LNDLQKLGLFFSFFDKHKLYGITLYDFVITDCFCAGISG